MSMLMPGIRVAASDARALHTCALTLLCLTLSLRHETLPCAACRSEEGVLSAVHGDGHSPGDGGSRHPADPRDRQRQGAAQVRAPS